MTRHLTRYPWDPSFVISDFQERINAFNHREYENLEWNLEFAGYAAKKSGWKKEEERDPSQ